jgi:hypothetical protein
VRNLWAVQEYSFFMVGGGLNFVRIQFRDSLMVQSLVTISNDFRDMFSEVKKKKGFVEIVMIHLH